MLANESRTAVVAAPSIVLLPSAPTLNASHVQMHHNEPSILGLELTRRTALASRRAGYGRIFLLARDHAGPLDTTVVPDWKKLAEALLPLQTTFLVIAPPTILSETDWLTRLAATPIEPAAWAAIPHHVVVLAAAAIPDALAVLHGEGGAYDIAAVQDRLTRRFGSAAPLPSEINPMVVTTLEHIRAAEHRLLQGLIKDTDGFMARHFDRRVSLWISRRLAPTQVTPSQITILSIAIGLCGAAFFLSPLWFWQTAGALLFLLHSIVDGCDGEVARLRFQESRYGGLLDFWGDNVVHVAVFGCMAAGWALSSAARWPLLLGAAAIIGILGSAGFVHWHQFRAKEGSGPMFTSVANVSDDPLADLLNAASRRDFIYIVPLFALVGKSSWLLVLAAIAAPLFFLLLLFLAARERLQGKRITAGA
jgi:phosphatidylglycerophosphate synthase